MAMARLSLFLVVLGILLVTDVSCVVDPPTIAPVSGNDSPVSQPPIQNVEAPSPAAILTSPPSPPPSEDVSSKNTSSSPSPLQSDSPSPSPESDVGNVTKKSSPPPPSSSSSSISSGKKAGIVVGVLIGAVLVGLGGFVYKKRQDNIRRAQYGSYV
ncbi:proline-rich receptor-like protein kinase PERK10 [Papaver somniferum]|uniref:proline-rich receptor-like protein kinase PERK10 n=1 Tax=Papaver somniferum TaxID=3469 RepID=UPI000E6F82CD|nr:proline-rich receptor-like protein kinase PERK10 [Papaver somniferum]